MLIYAWYSLVLFKKKNHIFLSPSHQPCRRALEQLNYLGALDDEGALTSLGNKMSELPLEPQLVRTLPFFSKHNLQCCWKKIDILVHLLFFIVL